MKKILMLLVALLAIPVSAHSQRHNFLGTEIGFNHDVDILSDIEVNRLRVRHVSDPERKTVASRRACWGDTYVEWIEMDGPINPDASLIIERLLDRAKQNPNRCSDSTGVGKPIRVLPRFGGRLS